MDWEAGTLASGTGSPTPYPRPGIADLGPQGPASRVRPVSLHRLVLRLRQRDRRLMGYAGDRGILESLLRRAIRDALIVCPYIREVDGFSFAHEGSRVTAAFYVATVYNGFYQQTEVTLS